MTPFFRGEQGGLIITVIPPIWGFPDTLKLDILFNGKTPGGSQTINTLILLGGNIPDYELHRETSYIMKQEKINNIHFYNKY